ncbi:MAG: cytochrome-c peroxidase, partial [Balneolaceae bacterium]
MSHRIATLTALTPLFTLLIIRILQSCTITAPDPITDNKADQVTLQIYFGQNILLHDLPDYANPEIPDYIQLPDPSIADITDIGATLGRVLFYDKQLSVDNSISCSSCHKQELAFSDVNIASVGVDGTTGRHSMRLVNALYGEDQQFFWDERASSLEDQSMQPIQDHIEMGFSGVDGAPGIQDLISKMEQIPYYPILFDRTFNSEEITEERMQMALAQFIRSIHSFDSRYDEGRAQVGNHIQPFPNFTQEENDGKLLFTTPPVFDPQSRRIDGGLGCAGCHRPPVFD